MKKSPGIAKTLIALSLLGFSACLPGVKNPAGEEGLPPSAGETVRPGKGPAPAPGLETGAVSPAKAEEVKTQLAALGQEVVQLETYLYLMRDNLLQERPVGTNLDLLLRPQESQVFDIRRVQVFLDEKLIFDWEDEPDQIDRIPELKILGGMVVPGSHELEVRVDVQGRKRGLFSYLEKYRDQKVLLREFELPEGFAYSAFISCRDAGGRFEIADRFQIDFELSELKVQGK